MLKENGNPSAEFDVNTITAFRVNVHATNESDLLDSHKSTHKSTHKSNTSQSNTSQSIEEKILEFCKEPRSLSEIAEYCGFKNRRNFREHYLNPLIGTKIQMTIPEKPTSRLQKYIKK